MLTFDELAEYILTNSKHNTIKDTKRVHIILDYPKLKWGDYSEYLMTLTWFTGIGWSNGGSKGCNVIFAHDLDDACARADEYDHAMISYIGTFYNNYHNDPDDLIHTHFNRFCESEHPCRGHILWHPNKQYGRLHLQSMFLSLKHWRDIDRPTFGSYTGEVMVPRLAVSNVHDDYTPHYICPSYDYTTVVRAEMAEYISRVLESGKTILNYDIERSTKFFTYPHRATKDDYVCPALDFERARNSNIIYSINNEKIIKNMTDVKFDVIYAPASGNLAERLWRMYGHENTKLVIFDNNKASLIWKQRLYDLAVSPEDIDYITKHVAKAHGSDIDNCSYKPKLVEKQLKEYSNVDWIDDMSSIADVEFKHHDLIKDPVFDVDHDKHNMLYFSNIFSYNFIHHTSRLEDINNKFNNYLDVDNCFVIGKNPFKDSVYQYKTQGKVYNEDSRG